MITDLRIAGLGVIADASLEPAPGFTVVTGETGAGKTMIVTGLSLLLGERADPGGVRVGADRARVEGRFTLTGQVDAEQLAELGAELDDDELLVARTVTAAGRSRCQLGGAQVTLAACGEVVGELVTIHGQSEQVRLAAADRQREILDDFAGVADGLRAYAESYARRRAAAAELTELREQAQARAREADLLRYGLDEIAAVDPQPGEDEELAEEQRRLQAVDDLRLAAHTAVTALSGTDDDADSGALTAVVTARRALTGAADTDPQAGPLAERAAELAALVADLSADVASYLADLEADPGRLESVTARLAGLQPLTRKYGTDIAEVLDWAAASAARLAELDGSDDRIAELTTQLSALDAELAERADVLSAARRAAADELAELVRAELAALAMPHARLAFVITDLAEPGPAGRDRVELQFSANPGAEPRALAKVASGGELSRIRLALEVVLAERRLAAGTAGPGQTLVFDEVDAGVGGAVAVEIGRRLARLAGSAQVVAVTHLAQVAAFADRHYVVEKADDGAVTTSGVRDVTDDRAAELARMMAGTASGKAVAHARELLDLARAGRDGITQERAGASTR